MIKTPILLGAPIALAMTAAIATPAQASAPLAVTMPVAVPMVALGMSQADCGMAPSPMSQPLASLSATRAFAKSTAILGGAPSALEKMRMAQGGNVGATTSHPLLTGITAPSTQLAPAALPMAAMGFGCAATSQMRAALPQISGSIALPRAPQGAFLGTERVRVGRTHFDAEWKRVANKELSSRDLTSALGAVSEDRSTLLRQVNGWVNKQIRYRSDGRKDNWADARETLKSRRGDCEDYAILKMQMLAAAGIRSEDMMLTLARDTMRRADHAVLLVRHDGEWKMLDMASNRVASAALDYGYRPVMSFSKGARYLHGQAVAPQQPETVRIAYAN